ncbi:MAG TPA: hypothetical protein PLO20_15600 [Thermogutta sp.]|nr:hypothetical protein [Thermogutta sp.]
MLSLQKMPWWAAAGIGVLVVGGLGLGTTWSYIKTFWRGVGKEIREATPIAFDLERLNGDLKDLEPEIRRNLSILATLEVDVENLQKNIAEVEKEQSKAMAEMRKLREALAEEKTEYEFGGQLYTRRDVEANLAKRMDRYQARKVELEAARQLLAEKQRNLEATRRKVEAYQAQYRQLTAQAESLAAQLKTLEASQAAGTVTIDGSRLSRAKELAKEIERRIRVAQKILDTQQKAEGEIPVDIDTRPITQRFDEEFGSEVESQPK